MYENGKLIPVLLDEEYLPDGPIRLVMGSTNAFAAQGISGHVIIR